jgi:hypothetical protein
LFNASRVTGKKGEECSMWDGFNRASGSSRRTPAAEDTTVVAATPLSTSSFSVDEILNNY